MAALWAAGHSPSTKHDRRPSAEALAAIAAVVVVAVVSVAIAAVVVAIAVGAVVEEAATAADATVTDHNPLFKSEPFHDAGPILTGAKDRFCLERAMRRTHYRELLENDDRTDHFMSFRLRYATMTQRLS